MTVLLAGFERQIPSAALSSGAGYTPTSSGLCLRADGEIKSNWFRYDDAAYV
jgi:hypothetical protein